MTIDSDSTSVYERFAQRCKDRSSSIAELIQDVEHGDISAMHTIQLKINDWVGESKLLGLDSIAEIAGELANIMSSWGTRFNPTTQGRQFCGWLDELADLSQRLATGAPDSDVQLRLRRVTEELKNELGATHEAARGDTNDYLEVCGGRRIVILDDSPIVGETLRMQLEGKGYRVALAETVAEFNQRLEEFKPELIFLDINMPDMRGDTVCMQLRERFQTKHVPIIFLSGLPDEELAELAEKSGADGYLSKQHGMNKLLSFLDEIMDQIVF